MTSLGHQAVMVFFVLSGFLIGSSVLRSPRSFSLMQYAVARLTRLWIVLIPALLFTFAVDRVIEHTDPSILSGARYAEWNSGPSPASPAQHSLAVGLGNVAFLQTIVVPVFGTNGPLWSLANEFWYYVLFPLVVIGVGLTGVGVAARASALTAAAVTAYLLPFEMLWGFLFWCFGVAAWSLSEREELQARKYQLATAALFVLALLLKSKTIPFISSDTLIAATFAAFAATIARSGGLRSPRLANASQRLSEISYSLYLFHFPMVALLSAALFAGLPVRPNVAGLAQYLLLLAALLAVGAAAWWAFERHTGWLRARVLQLGRRGATP